MRTDGTLNKNKFSLNNKFSMIFLDQPARAGYPYGNTVDNTPEAMKDTYEFLIRFLKPILNLLIDFQTCNAYSGKNNKSDSESNLKNQ